MDFVRTSGTSTTQPGSGTSRTEKPGTPCIGRHFKCIGWHSVHWQGLQVDYQVLIVLQTLLRTPPKTVEITTRSRACMPRVISNDYWAHCGYDFLSQHTIFYHTRLRFSITHTAGDQRLLQAQLVFLQTSNWYVGVRASCQRRSSVGASDHSCRAMFVVHGSSYCTSSYTSYSNHRVAQSRPAIPAAVAVPRAAS